MTEDMLEDWIENIQEQQAAGSSVSGSDAHANTLLSDMQAFKVILHK
jgi:hypothetical protein